MSKHGVMSFMTSAGQNQLRPVAAKRRAVPALTPKTSELFTNLNKDGQFSLEAVTKRFLPK